MMGSSSYDSNAHEKWCWRSGGSGIHNSYLSGKRDIVEKKENPQSRHTRRTYSNCSACTSIWVQNMSGLTCPERADRRPQQLLWRGKWQRTSGSTLQQKLYLMQPLFHDFIKLGPSGPPAESQPRSYCGRRIHPLPHGLAGGWVTWHMFGDLPTMQLVLCACAVIKVLFLPLCLSCGLPAPFRLGLLVSKSKHIPYLSWIQLSRSNT